MYKDDPFRVGYEKSLFNLFNSHPIKISVGGTTESVSSITKDDLNNCYNTFYNPSNMFVVVTGNIDPYQVFKIIEKNQSQKKFKKISKIELREVNEDDNVETEEETIKMNITIPKLFMSYKLNVENISIERDLLLKYLSIFLDLKFGSVSKFSEDMIKNEYVIDGIGYDIIQADNHIVIMLMAETKKMEELIVKLEEEITTNNIIESDFNRKKKTYISSYVYMSDSIYRINDKIVNDIILNDKVICDSYDRVKNLSFDTMLHILEEINFNHRTIVKIIDEK